MYFFMLGEPSNHVKSTYNNSKFQAAKFYLQCYSHEESLFITEILKFNNWKLLTTSLLFKSLKILDICSCVFGKLRVKLLLI